MTKEQRSALGVKGREHVMKNYNYDNYVKKWDEVITNTYEKHGSWENRKNYNKWELLEVA